MEVALPYRPFIFWMVSLILCSTLGISCESTLALPRDNPNDTEGNSGLQVTLSEIVYRRSSGGSESMNSNTLTPGSANWLAIEISNVGAVAVSGLSGSLTAINSSTQIQQPPNDLELRFTQSASDHVIDAGRQGKGYITNGLRFDFAPDNDLYSFILDVPGAEPSGKQLDFELNLIEDTGKIYQFDLSFTTD